MYSHVDFRVTYVFSKSGKKIVDFYYKLKRQAREAKKTSLDAFFFIFQWQNKIHLCMKLTAVNDTQTIHMCDFFEISSKQEKHIFLAGLR